ncbi:MAG: GNAT family N-acetyltransferase [Ferruginibacter sp.]
MNMPGTPIIKRTTTDDPDFMALIGQLDHELWDELNEDQATYDPFNKVPHLPTAIVVYVDDMPVASGCFKQQDAGMVEIKRMYVAKSQRGKGISKMVLSELETWARDLGFQYAVLETSVHFIVARSLYENAGYSITANYGPYVGLQDSVCFRKAL